MAKKKTPSKSSKGNDIMPQLKGEFERHTNVLMEKMDSTAKTVTEQYSSVIRKIDGLRDDVDELKNDMAIVKPAVEANSRGLKEVKSELNSINMAVMDSSRQIKQNTSKINDLNTKVDRIEQKLDTVTTDHEDRLKKLEAVR